MRPLGHRAASDGREEIGREPNDSLPVLDELGATHPIEDVGSSDHRELEPAENPMRLEWIDWLARTCQ